MAEVYTVDVPGGEREAWQCPYCSRMYPTLDEEGRKLECPNTCRRCGSPMDIEKSKSYQGEKASQTSDATTRRTSRV